MECDRPEMATIMCRTGVRERDSTGGGNGRCRYEIGPIMTEESYFRPSYYIIYIFILYKYYIQNIMIVV